MSYPTTTVELTGAPFLIGHVAQSFLLSTCWLPQNKETLEHSPTQLALFMSLITKVFYTPSQCTTPSQPPSESTVLRPPSVSDR